MKSRIVVILALLFSFIPVSSVYADDIVPALISISPTSGEIEGGETVTITGLFFIPSNTFRVDGQPVSSTYISDSQVSIVMPAHNIGTVSISAFLGISGSVLPNAYTYIDSPDPEPTPEPEPEITVIPTPTPTVSVVSQNTASVTVAAPVSNSFIVDSPVQQPESISPSPTPSVSQTVDTNIQTFPKNVTVYTGDAFFTIYATNIKTYKFRLTLQRYDNGWKNIMVSYRNGDSVAFYGVPPTYGRYRIVNVLGTVLRSFTIVDL